MSKGEFGEPWDCIPTPHEATIRERSGRTIAAPAYPKHAIRATRCVNALDGYRPENLAALITAVENVLERQAEVDAAVEAYDASFPGRDAGMAHGDLTIARSARDVAIDDLGRALAAFEGEENK